jgi:hypothetical protein
MAYLLNNIKNNISKNKSFISIGKILSKITDTRNYVDLALVSIKDCISNTKNTYGRQGALLCLGMFSKTYKNVCFFLN